MRHEILTGLCFTNSSLSAAEQVLVQFRDRFIRAVNANAIVHELKHANIIPDGVLKTITGNPDAKQQNEFLLAHLCRTCDEEALAEVCDLLTAVQGNRRMNALGRDMKSELEKGNCCVCVHVCVRVCVCACMRVYYRSINYNVLQCSTYLVLIVCHNQEPSQFKEGPPYLLFSVFVNVRVRQCL